MKKLFLILILISTEGWAFVPECQTFLAQAYSSKGDKYGTDIVRCDFGEEVCFMRLPGEALSCMKNNSKKVINAK